MPLTIHIIFALMFSVLLTACSDDSKPDAAAVKPFETQTQALDQAKQLEQSMLDAADAKRKEIDAQTK